MRPRLVLSDSAFRLDYAGYREVLRARLAEPAPGRLQLLAGPRQVSRSRTGRRRRSPPLPRRAAAEGREEPLEVDGVVEGSWGRFALEVKTGPFRAGELAGLLELARRHPELTPLVLCDEGEAGPAERAGVAWMDWRDFLAGRPRG